MNRRRSLRNSKQMVKNGLRRRTQKSTTSETIDCLQRLTVSGTQQVTETYNLETLPTYDYPDLPFKWTTDKKLALLECMISRKPAGLNKHLSMLLIKMHLSHRLKLDVPIDAIWSFVNDHWNIREADLLETDLKKIKKKNFELPQTEDWKRIIEEQGALINKYNNTNKDEDPMEPESSGF
ncbi:hypothetical protein ACI65C_009150 [Semiaphis heraclei]